MKLTFLGTGTSQGVPVIGCRCEVCTSQDPRDARLRTSAMIETHGLHMVIDAGPDFRQQMLRTGVRHIDAILLTHEHKDHIGGLDDVRAFNFVDYPTIRRVALWANARTAACIRKDFDYAFAADKYRGVPEIELHEVDPARPFCVTAASGPGTTPAASNSSATAISAASGSGATAATATPGQGVEVVPIAGHHSPRFEVTGYRIGRLAYLTDFKSIDEAELAKLRGVDTLVVNALRHKPHDSHFCVEEALELIRRVQPRAAYLTHMSHEIGLAGHTAPRLPPGVYLAYDTLQIEIPE